VGPWQTAAVLVSLYGCAKRILREIGGTRPGLAGNAVGSRARL